jgi:threonine 3-dehydrogenase
LITGGTGNLASRLLVPLVRRGDDITLLDVQESPDTTIPEIKECRTVIGDLSAKDEFLELVRESRIDSIFHMAAILSGDAEDDSERAWKVNMEGTRNVLEAARLFDVGKVVFTSTVATFGDGLPEPVDVDAPQWPVSLYGATKVAGERLGVYYYHRYGLDFRCVRLTAVTAPRGAPGGASGFCSLLYREAVENGKYDFYLKPETRAPIIYVEDAVRALLDLHDAPSGALTRRVYQVSGIGPSAEEMAASVKARLPHVEIGYKPDPVRNAIVESWPKQLDASDAARDWGWESRFDLDQMTEAMIATLSGE